MAKGKYEQWLTPERLKLLEKWAKQGLTDREIAGKIGINVKTLYDWKNKYSNFSNALKKGKDYYDDEVEDALYKSTQGYYVEEEVTEISQYGDGKKQIKKKTVKRYIPPSTTAIIYWLQNRRGDRWKTRASEAQEKQIEINRKRLELEEQKQEDNW